MLVLPIPTEVPVAVKGPPQGTWTAADWEELDHTEGYRYEIIDGVLYVSTSPGIMHQWAIKRLYARIGLVGEEEGLGEAFFAPIGVFMPGAQPVQPDFLFILKANINIIGEKHIRGVPDLIVEVLSPGNQLHDQVTKLAAYERAGVPEYGILDYMTRQLSVYRLKDGRYDEPLIYGKDDMLAFACLPTVLFRISDLFSGAPQPKS
jgi:Uma2 family endonuclease